MLIYQKWLKPTKFSAYAQILQLQTSRLSPGILPVGSTKMSWIIEQQNTPLQIRPLSHLELNPNVLNKN